ncbi:MAG: MYXO-CTERM sorting domain-containing protein [Deltaproteobacteria bacterium]
MSNVVGPCRVDGTCEVGACTARNVCSGASGASGGGCACTIAGARGEATPGSALALAALALVLATWRRR